MSELTGKTAVVIRALGYSNVGRAIALVLAKRGADLAVHGPDANEADVSSLVQEVRSAGGKAIPLTGDSAQSSEVERMFREVVKGLGGVDILVSAGASVPRSPLFDAQPSLWKETLRTNMKGPFLCSQEAARYMVQAGTGGKVLFLSTHAARIGIAGLGVYSASQAGIVGLARSMALELADHNIAVNVLSVGRMREDPGFSDTRERNNGVEQLQEWNGGAGTALGRPPDEWPASLPLDGGISLDEVADAVCHLVSAHGDHVTGQVVDLTGGQLIGK